MSDDKSPRLNTCEHGNHPMGCILCQVAVMSTTETEPRLKQNHERLISASPIRPHSAETEPRPIVYVVTCLIQEPPFPIVSIVEAFDTVEAADACYEQCKRENTQSTYSFFMHHAKVGSVSGSSKAERADATRRSAALKANSSIHPSDPNQEPIP